MCCLPNNHDLDRLIDWLIDWLFSNIMCVVFHLCSWPEQAYNQWIIKIKDGPLYRYSDCNIKK
jgi:hypothetical protein